jgi:hypothetical protein
VLEVRWISWLTALVLIALPSEGSRAWDNEQSHHKLAERAIKEANSDGSVSSYLRSLELRDGVDEGLALQLGFDSEIDYEIGPSFDGGASRLTSDLNRREADRSPENLASEIRVKLNPEPPCSKDAGFEACLAERVRSDATTWIRLGTFAEDNPSGRTFHPTETTGSTTRAGSRSRSSRSSPTC